ncbi:hypothetical protein NL476_28145, partial [Klebsiella pneumoniae]|nr:hypothetical protein [Klebsiella pneumoniae]
PGKYKKLSQVLCAGKWLTGAKILADGVIGSLEEQVIDLLEGIPHSLCTLRTLAIEVRCDILEELGRVAETCHC